MYRKCSRCQRTLAESDFHRHGKGLQSWCKQCKREYSAGHYTRNRERRVAHNREQRRRAVDWYQSLKRGRACTDCGGVFHPAAMQWDHLPGVEKLASVAELYGYSRDRVLAEIAKCELVCANCHAVRTYRRKREIVVDDGPHAYSGPTPP